MAYLAKLAQADAIAIVLNLKSEGYVTYVAHNVPSDTRWADVLWRAQQHQQDTETGLRGVRALQAIIRRERDPSQLLERATAQLAEIYGADGVSIMLADAEGELFVRTARGLSEEAKRDRKR